MTSTALTLIDFWTKVAQVTIHGGMVYSITCTIVLIAILLARVPPSQRLHILRLGLYYMFSLFTLLGAGLLGAYDHPAPARFIRAFGILVEGLVIIRLAGLVMFKILAPVLRLSPQQILQDIAVALGSVVFALVRLHYEGVDLTGIITTSAVITAVIGFSLQDTFGNILGGLLVELDHSLEIGDWIRHDNTSGRIVGINWRVTEVETNNWETHIIPNTLLTRSKVQVLGRRYGTPRYWRRWIYFNIDFRHPPSEVIRVIEDAMSQCGVTTVAFDPRPNCILTEFQDSTARYAVRYYLTDISMDDGTDSQVRVHIYYALKRANISLSIPAHSIFVTEETVQRKEIKAGQLLQSHLEVLKDVPFFQSFTDEELSLLAARVRPAPFATGDVMVRQGAVAHWLYIIHEGTADVMVEGTDGVRQKLSELTTGSIFGEMGLMTGATREASVVATSAVECFRLDKASFLDILRKRPNLAEDISRSLAEKKSALDAVRENLSSEASHRRLGRIQQDFLGRIRQFFEIK